MASKKKGQVVSTGAMTALKVRLTSAQRGYKLMKTKSDALLLRFRLIALRYCELKEELRDLLEDAWFVLVRARYVCDGFQQLILEGARKATIKIYYEEESVVGITLRNFQVAKTDEEPYPLAGLGHGGLVIQEVKEKFHHLAHYIVELAAQQAAFIQVSEALRTVKRRVNALEHVVIPSFEEDIKIINQAIEEEEREQFYRMKKIQQIKRKTTEKLTKKKRPKQGRRSRIRSRKKRAAEATQNFRDKNEQPGSSH